MAQSWTHVRLFDKSGVPPLEEGFFFHDTGIIIGGHGYIIRSNNYFNSFIVDSSYSATGLGGLTFVNRDTGYMFSNKLLETFDGGNTWAPKPNGTYPTLFHFYDFMLFVSADTGYFSANEGDLGTLYFTYDGGINWFVPDTSSFYVGTLTGEVLRMHVIQDSIIYVLIIELGSDYLFTIKRSSDYGKTWSFVSNVGRWASIDYGDFYFLDDTTIILATTGYIRKSVDGGVSFAYQLPTDDFIGDPRQAIAFSGRDTGYVAFGQSVYKTYDAGNTWTNANFSFAPEDSNDYISFITMGCSRNAVVGTMNKYIYKMEPDCGITGIADIPDVNSFSINPNPTNNKLYVTINNQQKSNLQIFAIDGRAVMPQDVIQQDYFEVDVSNLATGLYFLVLQNDEGRVVRKFVKE